MRTEYPDYISITCDIYVGHDVMHRSLQDAFRFSDRIDALPSVIGPA
ncbi:hypothetical protein KUA12_02830 [Komagataeibacter oboediens]|nr:hypothetical protein [Komagataeibacter oboediens]